VNSSDIDMDFLAKLLLKMAQINSGRIAGGYDFQSRQPFTTTGGLQMNYGDPMTRFIAGCGRT